MKPIFEDEIVDTILACPYCGTPLVETWKACCAAARPPATFYKDKASEVTVVPTKLPVGSKNNLWRANEYEE